MFFIIQSLLFMFFNSNFKFLKNFFKPYKKDFFLIIGVTERTGYYVAKIFKEQAINFKISDLRYSKNVKEKLKRLNLSKKLIYEGKQTKKQLKNIQHIIISPGVSRNSEIIQEALKNNIKIWSDFDFFFPLYEKKKIIAITGTDGKTTTVTLLEKLLASKYKVKSLGNNGVAFCSVIPFLSKIDVLVFELSSYMLEEIVNFQADIAYITNIADDHLDRYKTKQDYVDTKFNLIRYHSKKTIFIKNIDDHFINHYPIPETLKEIKTISMLKKADFMVEQENFMIENRQIKNSFVSFIGKHNEMNLLLVLSIASLLKVSLKKIQEVATKLKPLPHRMEKLKLFREVIIINDSKATTLQAVLKAIESFEKKVTLILGGRGKGISFTLLFKKKSKIKRIFCYGEEGLKIEKIFKGSLKTTYSNQFNDCVNLAWKSLKKNDILLLSPGCISQDQFKDYEERGDVFKEQIHFLDQQFLKL